MRWGELRIICSEEGYRGRKNSLMPRGGMTDRGEKEAKGEGNREELRMR